MQEGTVVRWLKAPGDRIAKDEAVVEILTDKVTTTLESPAAGILEEILVAEDSTVAIATPLARIQTDLPQVNRSS